MMSIQVSVKSHSLCYLVSLPKTVSQVVLVDLVFGLAVRENPRGFMDSLMGKQSASNDQVIEVAELY